MRMQDVVGDALLQIHQALVRLLRAALGGLDLGLLGAQVHAAVALARELTLQLQ